MTAISKNVNFNKLSKTILTHRTSKMKLADVKIGACINFVVNQSKINSKFKVGDYVQIFKNKDKFSKVHMPNQSEVKDTTPWTHKNSMLNGQVRVVYLIVELINHIFQKTIVNLIIFMVNIIVKNKCFLNHTIHVQLI